jgi:hypothetical protein
MTHNTLKERAERVLELDANKQRVVVDLEFQKRWNGSWDFYEDYDFEKKEAMDYGDILMQFPGGCSYVAKEVDKSDADFICYMANHGATIIRELLQRVEGLTGALAFAAVDFRTVKLEPHARVCEIALAQYGLETNNPAGCASSTGVPGVVGESVAEKDGKDGE